MPNPARWEIGARLPYGTYRATEADLIGFARELDPQPMHLDGQSDQARMMGGLIGSGWQTVAVSHRLLRESLLNVAGLHLQRVNTLRWSAPVRPDDVLTATATVLANDAALTLQQELTNQNGEIVMALEAVYGPPPGDPAEIPGGPYEASTTPARPLPFDKAIPGTITFTGEHCFEAEAVARYRATYDPGEASSVAPWHLCAQWLRLNIARWDALEAAGETLPERGPGLGLTDVIWPHPVQAGERLRYFSRTVSARASSSRAGWGIIANRNYALNDANEVVVAFSSAVLIEGSRP